MKKIVAFLEKYPLVLAALVAVMAVLTGFASYVCFQMFDMYKPAEILNEHLATFALPVGIMFLYFFVRSMHSLFCIFKDLIKEKLHMQHSKH